LINTLFIIFDDVFQAFWLLPWSCSYLIFFLCYPRFNCEPKAMISIRKPPLIFEKGCDIFPNAKIMMINLHM
jgi:hypothetical protein